MNPKRDRTTGRQPGVFVWALGDAPNFGGRSDKRPDFLLGPCVEPGDRVEGKSTGEPECRSLRTYAGELCQRFRRARKAVGFRHVFGGLCSPQKTILINRCVWSGIHRNPASLPRNISI
jgi:hypothetical protein